MVRSHCAFIEDIGNVERIEEQIAASRAGKYKPTQRDTSQTGSPIFKNHVGMFYHLHAAGEGVTNPKTRAPPFRVAHFKRLISAVLNVRAKQVNGDFVGLNLADIYFVNNGGKD